VAVRESTGTENSSFGFNRSFSSGYFALMGILEGVILPWYPGICQAGVSTDRLAGNDHLEESPNSLQCENICDVSLLIGGPYDRNSSDMLIPYVPTVPSGWTASSLYGFWMGRGLPAGIPFTTASRPGLSAMPGLPWGTICMRRRLHTTVPFTTSLGSRILTTSRLL